MQNEVKGYIIPIHKSLTEEMMIGGVPRDLAIMNGAVGVSLGLGGRAWYIIPIVIFIHICLAYAHKNDSQFLLCLRRYFYQKKYYGT